MDFETMASGQPIEVDPGGVAFEACCDCDLVHLVCYEITDSGQIRITKYRDDYQTGAAREAEKKKKRRRVKGA